MLDWKILKMFDNTTLELYDENSTSGSCHLDLVGLCEPVDYINYTIMLMIGVNAVGIGGHVDGYRLFVLLTKPFVVCLAMCLKVAILPAVALGLVLMLSSKPELAISTLVLLMTSHEGVGNLLILLLDGDLTTSVAVSSANSFTATAFLPLWAIIYEYQIYGKPGQIKLPVKQMFTLFSYLCTAFFLGYTIRKKYPKSYDKFWTLVPGIAALTIIFIITAEIYLNVFTFSYLSIKSIGVACVVTVGGLLSGATVGWIFRQSRDTTLVLCIESGIRTTFIIRMLTYGTEAMDSNEFLRVVPFLSSMLSIVPAFIVVIIVRSIKSRKAYKANFHGDEELSKLVRKQNPDRGDI